MEAPPIHDCATNKEQSEQVGPESTAGAGEGAREGEVDSESEAESMVTVVSEPEEEQVKEKEKAKGGSAKRAAENGRAESVAGGKKQRPGVGEVEPDGAVYGDSSPNEFPLESPLFTGGPPLDDPGGEERMDV